MLLKKLSTILRYILIVSPYLFFGGSIICAVIGDNFTQVVLILFGIAMFLLTMSKQVEIVKIVKQ